MATQPGVRTAPPRAISQTADNFKIKPAPVLVPEGDWTVDAAGNVCSAKGFKGAGAWGLTPHTSTPPHLRTLFRTCAFKIVPVWARHRPGLGDGGGQHRPCSHDTTVMMDSDNRVMWVLSGVGRPLL
eukprot:361801-Chlamydomonas_euryale.AAC.4